MPLSARFHERGDDGRDRGLETDGEEHHGKVGGRRDCRQLARRVDQTAPCPVPARVESDLPEAPGTFIMSPKVASTAFFSSTSASALSM